MHNDLWPLELVAAHAGLSARTMFRRLSAGSGPAIVKRGKRSFVAKSDAEAWIERQANAAQATA